MTTPQLLTVVKEDTLKTWTPEEWKQWVIEPKHDGARLIYHKGQFLSRTGKPFHNLEHIAEELKHLRGWTLDGEVYGDDWASTMSVARASKTKKDGASLRFGVFDVLLDEEWEEQHCEKSLRFRSEFLQRLILKSSRTFEYVHLVGRYPGISFEAFQALHQQNLENGCDGTVLKRRDSLYEFKRVKTWLKVKPVETFDCLVVGWKTGTGKYTDMIGALEILVSPGVTCYCSGMSDAQRKDWRTNEGWIIGKTIEVQARGVHQSGALIEPRFIRIREDK
jgi:DNA ligase-1